MKKILREDSGKFYKIEIITDPLTHRHVHTHTNKLESFNLKTKQVQTSKDHWRLKTKQK